MYELEKYYSAEIISDCIATTKNFCELNRKALTRGINNSVGMCTLTIEMGEKVYFSLGSEKNFKITTVEDIEMFKALLTTEKPTYLK